MPYNQTKKSINQLVSLLKNIPLYLLYNWSKKAVQFWLSICFFILAWIGIRNKFRIHKTSWHDLSLIRTNNWELLFSLDAFWFYCKKLAFFQTFSKESKKIVKDVNITTEIRKNPSNLYLYQWLGKRAFSCRDNYSVQCTHSRMWS